MVPTLRAAGHPFWVVLSAPDLIACLLLQVQDTALSQEVSFVLFFFVFCFPLCLFRSNVDLNRLARVPWSLPLSWLRSGMTAVWVQC